MDNSSSFLAKRKKHLENKLAEINRRLRQARFMPAEHEQWKRKVLIPQVTRALEKIENGESYGICEECGDPIPRSRLKRLPEAEYCVDCQSHKERLLRHGVI